MKKYLRLNDIEAYKLSFHLSNYVWNTVIRWDYFAKKSLGDQFTRSIDSISANIAEGFGRYNKKDKIKFYMYSRGSIQESLDWNEKAKVRSLLLPSEYEKIFSVLNQLPKELHSLIRFTNDRLDR